MLGVLSIIAGLILVKHPFSRARRAGDHHRHLVHRRRRRAVRRRVLGLRRTAGTNIAVGILDVVAGIVVLAWPDLSLKTLAVLAGIVFVIRGMRVHLRRPADPQAPEGPGRPDARRGLNVRPGRGHAAPRTSLSAPFGDSLQSLKVVAPTLEA